MHSLSHYQHPPPDRTFVITDEPLDTPLLPTVHGLHMLHSWGGAFSEFGRIIPLLWHHTEYFTVLDIPWAAPIGLFTPPNPGNH